MNILFKYPSRSRPRQFIEGIENIINNLKDKNNYHIACTIDRDDPDMNNEAMIEKILSYPNTSIQRGTSTSKIDAVNRDLPDYGDIIIVMSDDMRFTRYGFDDTIREDFKKYFPDGDGLLHYPDGYANERVCTMAIIGRKYYERFGYIYHPDYYSLWCDDEQTDVAKLLGKYQFISDSIIQHQHYANGRASKDALYRRNDTYHADRMIYEKRKANNFL